MEKTTILLAPNAFKGSLTAPRICTLLRSGLSRPWEILSFPACDGGDGSAEIIASYFPGSFRIEIEVSDALGRTHKSGYYRNGTKAIVELADICGLKTLSPDEYDIMNTHTRGFGQAILHAVRHGATELILCVGGSASVDGGLGALEAIGLKINKTKNCYNNQLIELKSIDTSYLKEKFNNIRITILCDVENPLCGPTGAASVFGPQKGATPDQVAEVEEYMKNYARFLSSAAGRDISFLPYGGAAGGIAAAFSALLQAKTTSGAGFYCKISGLEQYLSKSKIIVTGEGRIDKQSLYGKIPGIIAHKGRLYGNRVIAVAGSADPGISVFDRVFQLSDYAPSLEASILRASSFFPLLCRDLEAYLKTLY